MSLKVWLPLNGNLNNQGLSNIVPSGTPTFLTEGKIGQCISLTPRVSFTGLPEMHKFTILFWLKVDSCTLDWADSLSFSTHTAEGTSGTAFRFEATKTSRACSFHNNATYAITSGSRILITSSQYGEWHHCGFAYDGEKCYTYIDGIKTYTDTGLGGSIYSYFHIGETNNIVGGMNDLRIYDECLSDKEIKEIYKTLILHYKLNDPTKIKDYSGYKHDGTIGRGYLVDNPNSPIYNNCVCFQYDSPYITIPTIDFSGFANSFTIAWWSNISSMSGKMAWGFSDGNRLNLYPTSSKFCCNTGDGANNSYMNGSSTIPFSSYNNGWHHYVMTADGTNNKLYIDGVYKGTAQTYKGITGTQIILSGWDTGTSYKWRGGWLSDFRIYATTLSDSDIKQLAKSKAIIDNKQNLYTFELQENNYAQLDYLEATGTQYIVTDVKMKDIARVTLEFQYTDIGTDQGMFGWLYSGSVTNYNRTICLYTSASDSKFHTWFGLERTDVSSSTVERGLTMIPSRIIWHHGYGGGSNTYYTISYTQTMPIFALRNDGAADGFKNFSKAKLYYIKFYDSSGTLLGDFVPALDSNDVACLYDKFSQQFYYNQGTGDFSYGNIIRDSRNKSNIQNNGIITPNELLTHFDGEYPGYEKLEYIEGDGSQSISTGIGLDGSETLSFDLDMSFLPGNSDNGWKLLENINGNITFSIGMSSIKNLKSKGTWQWSSSKNVTVDVSVSEEYGLSWGEQGHFQYDSDSLDQGTTKLQISGFSTSSWSSTQVTSKTWNYQTTEPTLLFPSQGNPWRFYHLSISNPGTTDFIPIKRLSDGDIGIYDITNNIYYSGNGGFIAGPSLEPQILGKARIYQDKIISNNFYEI